MLYVRMTVGAVHRRYSCSFSGMIHKIDLLMLLEMVGVWPLLRPVGLCLHRLVQGSESLILQIGKKSTLFLHVIDVRVMLFGRPSQQKRAVSLSVGP